MSKWKEYRLGEILAPKGYIRGPFGSALKRTEMKLSGYVVYEQQHAIYNTRNFRYFIDESKFNDLKRFKTLPNDLIISCSGTVGEISIIQESDPQGIISQALLALRPNLEIISPKFLFYFFKNRYGYNQLISASHGSVQVNIAKREVVESIKISLPKRNIQNQITEILSSLDDKIELNNKINQELETLAQTLFKQWFIDFEFPNENGEPYKSSGGEMVESELGEIPKRWYVSTIGEITEAVTKGTTPTTIGGKFTERGINFIKVESLTEQGTFIKTKFSFIDEYTNQLLKRSIIKDGDVLFSIAGTIGRVAVVTKDILPANTNQAIAIIRPNKVDSYFLKLLMQSALIQNDTKSNVVQAVQANLSLGVIKATKFIKPLSSILAEFQSVTKEIYEQVNILSEENEVLTILRDTLLPKLISGELEINEISN
jgi:type I restriction enzyme S subunit